MKQNLLFAWDILNLGSPVYFGILILTAGMIVGLYFLFRNQSRRAQLTFLYIMMGVNIFQHLFKFWVWPHMWGEGFSIQETALNVCAFMILISPFAHLFKSRLMKQFVSYIGTIGPIASLFVPVWFIGESFLQWDYLRFWFCHAVLIITSLMPVLWKITTFRFRDFWKIGLVFFVMLACILCNNVIFYTMLGHSDTLYDALYKLNPMWMMHPPENALIESIFRALSPSFFFGADGHTYTPILYMFIPMYLFITILGFVFGMLLDFKGFKADMAALKGKLSKNNDEKEE